MGLRHHGRSVGVSGRYHYRFSSREERGPRHADWRIDVVPTGDRVHRSCVLAGVLHSQVVCLRAVD
jgi:hypothetical protein